MRREGDEIRLVPVLAQVVFRCVRIVLFGTWFGTEEGRRCYRCCSLCSGESVPHMKDAVPSEARALDLENDRCHCLLSRSRVVRASDGDSIPADSEIPATPDGGCLCYALRTGFYSSYGELLQVIGFSRESVIGDLKEIMVALAILTCFAMVAAGYVLRRGLLEGEKTPHELIIKCIIILTSVVPRGLPMQTSGEDSAHVSPLCRCVLH